MENFIDAFKRDHDGAWICVRDVTLEGPGGRIQLAAGTRPERGQLFMGVDLAGFIEANARAGSRTVPDER